MRLPPVKPPRIVTLAPCLTPEYIAKWESMCKGVSINGYPLACLTREELLAVATNAWMQVDILQKKIDKLNK